MTSIPQELATKLNAHGQTHVTRWWDELTSEQRDQLQAQVHSLDLELIAKLHGGAKSAAEESPAEKAKRATPPPELVRLPASDDEQPAWRDAEQAGEELLRSNKVGIVLVAGGQGTRLGFPHPKGMFPIGPVTRCPLFLILMEQAIARSRRHGCRLPYYFMTSDATHDETVAFFEKHQNFGYDAELLSFFRQGNMPAVDASSGRLLMDAKHHIASSPDGHGGMLAALSSSGLLDDMRERGVEHLYYHQVDNPTAIVCDPAFLGHHLLKESDLTTKVVAKAHATEKMGLVCGVDGLTQIIEYSDLPDELAEETNEDGGLKLWAGNMAIHVFRREFLEQLLADPDGLPFHVAHKKVPHLDDAGKLVHPEQENANKFERYIFDALPKAKNALVVEADRTREFNPVKNAEGNDSPATSRAAMSAIAREWLTAAGQRVGDDAVCEVGPLFALDAEEVAERFQKGTVYNGRVSFG